MSELVSVVIVAYNKESTVEAAIRSVLAQTYPHTEILVVDDGSTDHTADRVKPFLPRVRYLQKPNGGTGSARNLGVQHASGRFVAFLDGDDLWLPDKLEIQMRAFQEEPALLAVQCGAHYVDDKLRILETKLCHPRRDTLSDFLLFRNLPAFASAVVIRKEALLKLGGFGTDLVILSDWDMVCRLSRSGTLRSVPKALVLYRQYPNNQSRDVKIHLWSGVRLLRRFFRSPGLNGELLRLKPLVWARFYAMLSGGYVRNKQWARGLAWGLKAVRTSPRVIPYVAGMPLRRLRRIKNGVAAGIAAGILTAWTPGGVFVFALAGGLFFFLRRLVGGEGRRFVSTLFLVGFCLRAALSLGLDAGSWRVEGEKPRWTGPANDWSLGVVDKTRMYLKIGDSDYYSQRGYALSQYAKGVREPVVIFRINQYGWNGYVYAMGWFYTLFGYSPYAVKLINCFLGALLGPLVFLIARIAFNLTVARWSALAVAFFPSMLLWSVSNLKDIPLIFTTLVVLFLFQRLPWGGGRARLLRYGLALAGTIVLHATIRSAEFTWILVAGLGLAYGLTRLRIKPWQGALAAAGALGCLFLKPVGLLVNRFLSLAFEWHAGFAMTPGMSYRFLPDSYYVQGYVSQWSKTGRIGWIEITGILKALAHYLLEPIPGIRQPAFPWVTWPQMFLWYAALGLSGVGILWSFRHRYRQTLFLFIPLALWSFVSAIGSGNVGTVFRIRDMVAPLYLMFACAGAWFLMSPRGRWRTG
ncbi:MAG: glycosyltransferase [Candidatus Omnitrophica bacterium]|nr:glycosyltransferase [Candidatus Omnitrophota bacterium]